MNYASYGLILLDLASQCQAASGRSFSSSSSRGIPSPTARARASQSGARIASHSHGPAPTSRSKSASNASQVVTVADDAAVFLPTTGTGLAYAAACNNAKQSWVEAGGSSFLSTTVFQTSTSSVAVSMSVTATTITEVPPSATLFTLCDGYPRLSGNISTSYSVVNYETTIWSTFATTTSVFVNVPAPVCTIGKGDCAALQQSYDEVSMTGVPVQPVPPICGPATTYNPTFSLAEPLCAEQFATVQLLFWPVTTASNCDFCSLDKCRTTTMSQTIPGRANTFVFHNVTLTSPTVYMALSGTFAYTSSGTLVSRDSELILPQSSTAVSSVCGQLGSNGGQLITRSFNYADYAGPNIPAEAYRCQPSCFTNPYSFSYSNYTYAAQGYTEPGYTYTGFTTVYSIANYNTWATVNQCSTIYDDYRPVLSIPAAFSSLAPAVFVETLPGLFGGTSEFTCQFMFNSDAVFFDPPLALTQASEAAAATLPAYLITATPGMDGIITRPVQTASPEGTATWSGPKETGRPGTGGASIGTASRGSGSQAYSGAADSSGESSDAISDAGSRHGGQGGWGQQHGSSQQQQGSAQQQQGSAQQQQGSAQQQHGSGQLQQGSSQQQQQGSSRQQQGNSQQQDGSSPQQQGPQQQQQQQQGGSSPQQQGSSQQQHGAPDQQQGSSQQQQDGSVDQGQRQPDHGPGSTAQAGNPGANRPMTTTSASDGRPLGDESPGGIRSGTATPSGSHGTSSDPAGTSNIPDSSSAFSRAGLLGCGSWLGLAALVPLLGMVVL